MKVLVVKVGAVGDVVMSLPLLDELAKTNCEVDWLCGEDVAPILESTDLVANIYTIDGKGLLFGSFWKKLRQLFKAWRQIAFKKYDRIIVAHSDWRYNLLRLFTFAKNSVRIKMIPGRYHGDEYANAISDDKGHRIRSISFPPCNAPISESVRQFFLEHSHQYVVLAPGGNPKVEPGKQLRMWPIEYYVQLAQLLQDEGVTIVIVGSKHDRWCMKYFSHLHVIDAIDRFSFVELVPIFSQTVAVVAHDSGPMHIAIWSDANLVALFGPTNPYEKLPLKVNRYKEHIRLLWGGEHLACRPCYDGKEYAPCANAICMKRIHPYEVYTKIQQLHYEKYSLSS